MHICGDTTDKLHEIAETGADCLSLDYKVDMGVAKDAIGDRLCLAGNVDPVSVLDQGTLEDTRRACRVCIEAMGGGTDGYILTSGCDLPPTVKLDNIKAMLGMGRIL